MQISNCLLLLVKMNSTDTEHFPFGKGVLGTVCTAA